MRLLVLCCLIVVLPLAASCASSGKQASEEPAQEEGAGETAAEATREAAREEGAGETTVEATPEAAREGEPDPEEFAPPPGFVAQTDSKGALKVEVPVAWTNNITGNMVTIDSYQLVF